jgi:pyridoxal phosphate enzyme (YggS family)
MFKAFSSRAIMIEENLAKVKKRIGDAINSRAKEKITGSNVTIVAVTKTQPAEVIKDALAAGMNVFGENKVQEAAAKMPLVDDCAWHLIGHLQTNKVKKAVDLFEAIYSVDSWRLLAAIDLEAARQGKRQNVLLQVNIAGEESKFGFPADDLPNMIKQAKMCPHIRLRGLMAIAPETCAAETVRPIFKKGYDLFCALKDAWAESADVDTLSMGMSGDFEIAVAEGANNVRLGTLIFGKRGYSQKDSRKGERL